MRFIVLGDLHYASYQNPEHAAARDRIFAALFSQAVALQPDLVFAIGDTTQSGLLPELRGEDAVAAAVGMKFIRITGNHDTATLEKAEIAPFFLQGHPAASAEELYSSFEAGPVQFVLLDTSRIKLSEIDWSGFVSDEQLIWLHQEIAKFNNSATLEYLVVLGHHPIYNTTHRSTEDKLNIANSEVVRAVFAERNHGQGVYICGHNHSNSVFGPDSFGWYHIQAGAPLVCQSFRLITIGEAGLELQTIDFDLSDPALLADFETTRQNIETGFKVAEFAAVYGAKGDLSLEIAAPAH